MGSTPTPDTMKNIWKRLLLINSLLWVFATAYSVYAITYGIVSLDWHRFIYGIIAVVIFSLSEVVIALIAD